METFYQPALAKLNGDAEAGIAPDYEEARVLFEQMFAADSTSWEHDGGLARQRYWDTFYRPASELLNPTKESGDAPDYEKAQTVFKQMFAADLRSRTYLDTHDLYLDTYYFPALTELMRDPASDTPPDYEKARELLQFVKSYDAESENYRDTLDRYYDTWYQQVQTLLDARDVDYSSINALLKDMFDTDRRSRDYLDARSIFWDSIYFPAMRLYLNRDYPAAREQLMEIINDGGQEHRATESLYLYTFYERGRAFLLHEDYASARSEYRRPATHWQ